MNTSVAAGAWPQVAIDDLGHQHASLIRALAERGIGSEELSQVFSTCLRLRCVRCGIQITGDEFNQMMLAETGAKLARTKLQRLKLGYCAREGCESLSYEMQLEGCDGTDGRQLLELVGRLAVAEKVAEQFAARERRALERQRRWMYTGMAMVIGGLLFVLIFVAQNRRLPFTQKKQKYQIAPESAQIKGR